MIDLREGLQSTNSRTSYDCPVHSALLLDDIEATVIKRDIGYLIQAPEGVPKAKEQYWYTIISYDDFNLRSV